MIVKIKNKDGLFSKGSSYPYFTKKGKMWSSLGYMKSHLRQLKKDYAMEVYKDCDVVVIDDNDSYKETIIPMNEFLIKFYKEKKQLDLKKDIRNLTSKILNSKNVIENELFHIKKYEKMIKEIESKC